MFSFQRDYSNKHDGMSTGNLYKQFNPTSHLNINGLLKSVYSELGDANTFYALKTYILLE